MFAEAKARHGLRRFRLRGLRNANIQGLLIAAGQNLKRFLAASGWGRRHAPCGSLLALPGQLPSLFTVERSTGEVGCLAPASLAIGGFFQRAGAL